MSDPRTEPAPEDVLASALWAIRGLPADIVMARVIAHDGEVLYQDWVRAPRGPSEAAGLTWYREQWGPLPAVDLASVGLDGFCSPIPLKSVSVEQNTVVLRGPRCTVQLWIPPWHGCRYSDIRWSDELAAGQVSS